MPRGGAGGALRARTRLGSSRFALMMVIPVGFFAYVGVLRAFGYPGALLLWSLPVKLLRRVARR